MIDVRRVLRNATYLAEQESNNGHEIEMPIAEAAVAALLTAANSIVPSSGLPDWVKGPDGVERATLAMDRATWEKFVAAVEAASVTDPETP